MTEVLNPTKKHHFGGTPPKVVIWGCDTKLKIKTSKNIEIWVQIPHVPQLLSEFFSPHLHQPWLSAGVQNALVCNCPKSMRWCFTCMFISWCKYWQRTIVDKSTYDKIYWKKGSTKIHFFQKASESSRTQNIISFSQSKTRAGHQKHSQNDEFHLFIVNCTCFCKKNTAGITSSVILKNIHLFIWYLSFFSHRAKHWGKNNTHWKSNV